MVIIVIILFICTANGFHHLGGVSHLHHSIFSCYQRMYNHGGGVNRSLLCCKENRRAYDATKSSAIILPALVSLSLLTVGPSYCDDRDVLLPSARLSSGSSTTQLVADVSNIDTTGSIADSITTGTAVKQRISTQLPSGVQYYDVVEGDSSSGLSVEEGRTVQLLWSLRRSNGYFVDSSSNYGDEPFIYKVGNLKKAIKGIDEGIRGMKPGGIRRISVPPSAAFIEGVEDGKPGPLPAGFGPRRQILTRLDREVWNFEIKLLKVK